MDFSSSTAPVSRETWAPRSPSPPPRASYNGDQYSDRAPPSGPRGGDAPRAPPSNGGGSNNGGDYERERDSRDSRREGNGQREGGYQSRRNNPPPLQEAEPNNVLGVFGLSIRTRERDLEDEFMRYGDVEKVVIVYDQRTDRSRGFGFVTMRTIEDATRVIEKLNGFSLHGRSIRVDYSATQKPHAPTPGQYMGVKRPTYDQNDRYNNDRRGYDRGGRGYDNNRYDNRGGYDNRNRGYDNRSGGYDNRSRGYDNRGSGGYDNRAPRDDRDRYAERDREDHGSRRDYDERPKRDEHESRRRSPSPRRRYSASPDRGSRAARDYEGAPAAGAQESSRY